MLLAGFLQLSEIVIVRKLKACVYNRVITQESALMEKKNNIYLAYSHAWLSSKLHYYLIS